MRKVLIYAAVTISFSASTVLGDDEFLKPYAGPYKASVVRVIDGDTILVDAKVWPGLTARYSVRERGIDAPEIHRVDCPEEKLWGEESKAQLESLYPPGTVVRLDDVQLDDFGRVVADVRRLLPSHQYIPLERDMLSRGLAEEWTPEMDDIPWCLLAQTRE